MGRDFLPGSALVCVNPAALSLLGAGILGGDPLNASQILFVALLRLTVKCYLHHLDVKKPQTWLFSHSSGCATCSV